MEAYIFIFITAVVFTLIGYNWGSKRAAMTSVAATIDSLIDDGYLQTRGVGRDMEILKWNETDD
jgi:hypothetical protein